MKYLGIDLGDVRTGLAVSDETGFLASGIGFIKETYRPYLAKKIYDIYVEQGCSAVVIGDPVNMNGSHGEKSKKAHEFANFLRSEYKLEVILVDERCTTMQAHKILSECNVRGKSRKTAVDSLSASIILQDFLDRNRRN